MESTAVCINCNEVFAKSSKGYERYGAKKVIPTTQLTVGECLSQFIRIASPITPASKSKKFQGENPRLEDRCVCATCYNILARLAKGQRMMSTAEKEFKSRTNPQGYISHKTCSPRTPAPNKRKLTDRSPVVTPRKNKIPVIDPEKHDKVKKSINVGTVGRPGFKTQICKHIQSGNYKSAFQIMMSKSSRARKQFYAVTANIVKKELNTYYKETKYARNVVSVDVINNFRWHAIIDEAVNKMPVTWNILLSLFVKKRPTNFSAADLLQHIFPIVGNIWMTIMYARFPRTCKLMQSINSIQLFKHGNSHDVSKLVFI